MTSDPDDDAELIARSLDGDEGAFVEVVRRHEAAVGAYLARRAAGNGPRILGDVWVAALASRATYDRSFPDTGPWLFGVAHNTLRRHRRSRPAEDPVADVTGMASGWDPWTAVDRRIEDKLEFIAAGETVAIIPAAVDAGRGRSDLTTIPLHGVDPGHVVLATRAADRSRLVAAFRKSAQDCLAGPAPAPQVRPG